MAKHRIDALEKTISSTILVYYYDKYAEANGRDYPEVKNPSALMDGITGVVKAIGEGRIPDNTILYVLEDEEDIKDPRRAQYVITITKGKPGTFNSSGYAIRLFYSKTQEVESISTFEDNQVVWSPDNMSNTKHPNRTKYYLGFAYMLCDKSPGFDEEPAAEKELSAAELMCIMQGGEIPPEMIEIVNPDEYETESAEVETEETLFEEEIPEQDDTEVIITTQEEYDEYDDLQTDYEELFD